MDLKVGESLLLLVTFHQSLGKQNCPNSTADISSVMGQHFCDVDLELAESLPALVARENGKH